MDKIFPLTHRQISSNLSSLKIRLNKIGVFLIFDLVKKFFNGVDFDKVRTAHPPELIFLCGGNGKKYFRPKIFEKLDKKFNVFQAEDVMNWQISKKFGKDLLELEKYVAALVSVIPIVCESEGSIAELGAFVSDKEIRNKLYIIIEEKFYVGPESESFIRWGPIENYKKNVDRRIKTNKKASKNTNQNKLYCFSKPINEKDVTGVCDALSKCKPKTSKCDFSNNYFHILLLIDIINVLSVATIEEIRKSLRYALKQAIPKPPVGSKKIKQVGSKQINEMLIVLIALGLIKERIKGEGTTFFVPIRKEFYLEYRYDAIKKYKNIYEFREEIIDEIYS